MAAISEKLTADLREEILIQILAKLPAKSLLRFSSVCKSWRSLIKEPYFTQKHLNNVIKNKDDPPMFFLRSQNLAYSVWGSPMIYTERIFDNSHENPLSVSATGDHDASLTVACSSCNGFVCLAHQPLPDVPRRLRTRVYLYNPITRKDFTLPPSVFEFETQILGFGLDLNDYKVIRIGRMPWRNLNYHDDGKFVEIYRSSTNRWSKLNVVLKNHHLICDLGVLFNGFFHWLHGIKGDLNILTFDFHAETFGEIQFSCDEMISLLDQVSITELDDSLAIFSINRNVSTGFSADVWVMKEYGVASSWTKKLSIDSSTPELHSNYNCYEILNFGFHSKNLKLLCKFCTGGDRLVTCTLENEVQEDEEGEGCKRFTSKVLLRFDNEFKFSGVSFRPTLVSFHGIQD